MKVLPLLCVVAALVGQALSQTDACQRVTEEDLGSTTMLSSEGILAAALNPGSEGGSNPGTYRVVGDSLHIVCEAQHQMQNRYRFTSVLVSYTCQSSDPRLGFCDGTTIYTDQLTLGCVDNAWSRTIVNNAEFALTSNSSATTSTQLASNCRLCINPDHPTVEIDSLSLTVAPDTHCVACETCDSSTGLGRCYGTLSADGEECCNFFEDSNCVGACSSGFFNSEFECIDCPVLSDNNGKFTYTDEQFLDSIATLNCNDGYGEINSPATCTMSGWSMTPFCTTVCPLLGVLQNGDIRYSSSNRIEGTTATYECNIGYLHVPNNGLIRTCQVGGAWSGEDLTCDACSTVTGDENCVECEYNANGEVVCTGCVTGYSITGLNDQCTPTISVNAGTSSCDTACIIGIVLAIVAVIVIATVVIIVAYVLYKYLNDPATKLAKTDAEGLNGVARDNPLYVEPAIVTEEGVDGVTETTPLDS